MNSELLRTLISQNEGAALEFKRASYRIDDPNSETKKYQKDELIKDVLSLANGNTSVVGETAYLVIGADDVMNADGTRTVYDAADPSLTGKRLLDIVNRACDPHLPYLSIDIIELDGKRLSIVTIPFSPHLHETTRRLDTSSRSFTEFTVFIRNHESVAVASAKERAAIQRLKQLRFQETRNAPPIIFGAITGAALGSVMMAALGEKVLESEQGRTVGRIVGLDVGGSLGAMFGTIYRNFVQLKSDWQYFPRQRPIIVIGGMIVAGVVTLTSKLLRVKSS